MGTIRDIAKKSQYDDLYYKNKFTYSNLLKVINFTGNLKSNTFEYGGAVSNTGIYLIYVFYFWTVNECQSMWYTEQKLISAIKSRTRVTLRWKKKQKNPLKLVFHMRYC